MKFFIHLSRKRSGKLPEWSNGPHSKCGVRVTVPGVRIPRFPLKYRKTGRHHCINGCLPVVCSVLTGLDGVPDYFFNPSNNLSTAPEILFSLFSNWINLLPMMAPEELEEAASKVALLEIPKPTRRGFCRFIALIRRKYACF